MILIGIFCALKTNAQDYFITFSGAGASSTVSSVNVENLTSGTSLTISGSDILHLTSITTGVNSIKNDPLSKIKIYPNPMTDCATVQIYPPVAGEAVMKVIDITGNPVAISRCYLDNSRQDFRLSGMKTGLYLINVVGSNYHFSGKLICSGEASGPITIEKINSIAQMVDKKVAEKVSKGVEATIDMSYTNGDRLKFTGTSGNFRTIITDIPDRTKTIIFNLMSVIDKDNNAYHIVDIGDQVWMEENLKTSKYRDGIIIPLVPNNTTWSNLTTPAYCWYSNSGETFKEPYGALYNGFAVGTGRICPSGWHVPTVDEYNTLFNYLKNNNFGYNNLPGAFAKSIASKTGWNVPPPMNINHHIIPMPPDVIGIGQQYNNDSGFNGFPAGMRGSSGSFDGIGYQGVWYSATSTSSSWDFFLENTTSSYPGQGGDSRNCGFSVRCIKGETKTLPNLVTTYPFNITLTTATSGATVTDVGETPITSRGVCWDTLGAIPTIDGNKTIDGSGTEAFTSLITGLKPGTVYQVRSYAINDEGISYGSSEVFVTDLADIEGNVYNTVTIGTQFWMVENLKTSKYKDGTPIPKVTDKIAWSNLSTSGVCLYNTDSLSFKSTYGKLYNWYTVATGKLCPNGWHIPSDSEWTTLTNGLGNENYAGGKLKEIGITHWADPNTGATDIAGFTALPGGARNYDGVFRNIGNYGGWWSSLEFGSMTAWSRSLYYNDIKMISTDDYKKDGLSVRCLKNLPGK